MLFSLEYGGDHITCPVCKTSFSVKWNTEYGDPLIGEGHETCCLKCDAQLTFSVHHEYTTYAIKKD